MNIPGPAGLLQAELTLAPDQADMPGSATFAILCHPHPQYGGNMHDMVLATLEAALLEAGVSCLRFNFRGVGGSSGSYAGGTGERDDLLAVAEWLTAEHAPADLWLGGYSFGAFIVWQALTQIKASRALLVAPPSAMMEFQPLSLTTEVDFFAGDQDSYVAVDRLSQLPGTRLHLLPGVDHFFQGHSQALQRSITDALT